MISFVELPKMVQVYIAQHLDISSLLQLAQTCKSMTELITNNDMIFQSLALRDFSTASKPSDQAWSTFYKRLKTGSADSMDTDAESGETNNTPTLETQENHGDHASSQLMDNVNPSPEPVQRSADEHVPIVGSAVNTKTAIPTPPDTHNATPHLAMIPHPGEEEDELDQRRREEHRLYNEELRREDMSLRFYLVEKNWGKTWMMFRTRKGAPLPGRITNNKLARGNGALDPNIHLPQDKYCPSPETHADIVSEPLWSYLEKAYGVQGKSYNEDDLQGPEYARLRTCLQNFKKSVDLYP